jgi:hypothetical protein
MPSLPTGIITQLVHPPYGTLTFDTHSALTYGLTSIQRIRGPVNVDAFGISFSFFTIPAAFGWTQQVHKDYEIPICEWVPAYTILSGGTVYGPSEVLTHEGDIYYFDQLLPTRIDVWVQVGCVVIPKWCWTL